MLRTLSVGAALLLVLLTPIAGAQSGGYVTASPPMVSFSATAIGSTSTATVTLLNRGTAVASIGSPALRMNAPGVHLIGSDCGDLAPGGTCTVQFAFTPTAIGPTGGRGLVETFNWLEVHFSGTGTVCFGDVPRDNVAYCDATDWLANRNITLGCNSNAYCPGDAVTRLQLALFLKRMAAVTTPLVITAREGSMLEPYLDWPAGSGPCRTPQAAPQGFDRVAIVSVSVTGATAAPAQLMVVLQIDGSSALTNLGGRTMSQGPGSAANVAFSYAIPVRAGTPVPSFQLMVFGQGGQAVRGMCMLTATVLPVEPGTLQ